MIPSKSYINETLKEVRKQGRTYIYFGDALRIIKKCLALEGIITMEHKRYFDHRHKSPYPDYYELIKVNERKTHE